MPARVKIKYPPRPIVKVNKALTRLRLSSGIQRPRLGCVPPATGKREARSHAAEAQRWRGETVPR